MSFRLVTLAFVVGMGAVLGACNSDDNIAATPDGGAGSSGSGGTAGSAGTGGSGTDGGTCDACPAEGATQCMGGLVIACQKAASGCLAWQASSACASGEVCSSDGAQCMGRPASCNADADCGCGGVCVSGECKAYGLGLLPPTCTTDAECGSLCYGLACVAGACTPRVDPACADPCTNLGATRCAGSAIESCLDAGGGCIQWAIQSLCANGEACNADGTACVTPSNTCASNADCGCGCACVTNECKCTGAIPSSCTMDIECGPPCSGLICLAGTCQSQSAVTCVNPCPTSGAERCAGSAMESCQDDGFGCLQWTVTQACPAGQGCNSDSTKCITPANTCAASSDCGCGCGCVANECKCTGAIPPSCTTDSDCGPACSGFVCVAGQCVSM